MGNKKQKITETIIPNKYFINGRWWDEVNMTIEIKGIEYDEYKSSVEYLKKCGINLCYGASNNFPISIDMPKGYNLEHLKMLNIDYKSIPRDKWFKY